MSQALSENMQQPLTQDVFELVLARAVDTTVGEDPRTVHLWWRAPQQGARLVQVYVDDELCDVSGDTEQREMWLLLDRSQPQRIELLAVDPSQVDAWQPRADLVQTWQPAAKARMNVVLLRDETLPVDAQLGLTLDGEAAGSDAMWSDANHRGGFGALFGDGAFGFDASTGPGLGEGELGMGPLGADGATWRWQSARLEAGEHVLQIAAHDAAGRAIASSVEHVETLVPLPPPRKIEIDEDFTLHLAL